MQSLYIHIPHCLQQCHYCDFATVLSTKGPDFEIYFQTLKKELASYRHLKAPLRSLYFGGGTPSLAPLTLLEDFIKTVHRSGYTINSETEITIEINPGTLSRNDLKSYLNMGINRFSLGIQTFNDELLKKIGRKHTSKCSLKSLEILSQMDLNLSVDLLYSLPHQSLEILLHDLWQFEQFSIQHVSPYYLTLPQSHFLNEGRKEETDEMEDLIQHRLSENQFHRYEVSNYSRLGFESRHNQVYWNHLDYLGLGVGAHSFLPHYGQYGARFWNSKNLKKYMTTSWPNKEILTDQHPQSYEVLKKHEALTDLCHTGLRQTSGFNIHKRFRNFDLGTKKILEMRLIQLKNEAYIQHQNTYWSLTPKGLKWANKVFQTLYFDETFSTEL